MPSSNKRLIPLALFLAIGIGVILLALQLSGSGSPDTYPLKGTWAHTFKDMLRLTPTRDVSPTLGLFNRVTTDRATDDFDAGSTWSSGYGYGHEVYWMDNTAYTEAGLTLSHLQPIDNPLLNLGGREANTVDSQGRLFSVLDIPAGKWLSLFHETRRLIEYDPSLQQATDWGEAVEPGNKVWYLATAGDRYIYMSVYNEETRGTRLRMFDRMTGQFKDLGPLKSYIGSLVGARDGQVYGTVLNSLFKYNPVSDQLVDLGIPFDTARLLNRLVLNADRDQLCGLAESNVLDSWLFCYDLKAQTAVTLTEPIWGHYSLAQFSSKLYGYQDNDPEQILEYDLDSHALTSLGGPPQLIPEWRYHFNDIAVDTKGSVYTTVTADTFPFTDYLFQYSPATNRKTYVQSLGNEGLAQILTGPGDQLYWLGGAVHLYNPHTYIASGSIESPVIKADMLVDQYIELGRAPTLIPALAWGNDGALYGVTTRVWQPGGSWLFRYDPAQPNVVTPVMDASFKSAWPQGASVLVADQAGRLISGSGDHLFTYDPTTHVVTDVTVPLSDTWQIGALTLGLNGHVYGTTVTSHSHGNPHLFDYDPITGLVQDLGVPSQDIDHVYALTTAANGYIYGGGGVLSYSDKYDIIGLPADVNILFAYNPNTGKVQLFNPPKLSDDFTDVRAIVVAPTGKVYLGLGRLFYPGGSFVEYDPASNQFAVLPLPVPGSVNALTLDNNGIIHGSTETLTGGYLFTYDPHQPARAPQASGFTDRNGIVALISGPGNVMYGTLGAHNSFYQGATGLVKFQSECPAGINGTWERLTYQATTPPLTEINIDVLDSNNVLLLANVKNDGSLSALDAQRYPAIKLRATLKTDDPSVTPILGDWRVTYNFRCGTRSLSPTPTAANKLP